MFIQAKKKREELRLPQLHFVVADDWIPKLGKAFNAWLQFHTWVDRQDQNIDDISKAKIPMTMAKVAEKLKMDKSTLYRKIIPVLWEFGLIDLIEFSDSNRSSQKPINIIPYEYPQNRIELATKPLEKCRDWKEDYNTQATFYGRQGGRKVNKNIDIKAFTDGCKNATVDGCENATVDGCENATVTVAKMQPNNYSNNSINVSNNFLNHDSNNLLMDDEEENPLSEENLLHSLINKQIDPLVAREITEIAKSNEIYIYESEIKEQLRNMYYEINVEGKKITNYPMYFLNGIVMQRQQRKTIRQMKKLKRIESEKYKQQYPESSQIQNPPIYYDWRKKNKDGQK